MADTARNAALRVLMACRKNGAWSDGALKEHLSGLDAREAALASRLCYGVLQNQMLLDFYLSQFVKGKLQPNVRDILRLAVYQLRFTDKIPVSAAVNEAVEQAKRSANAQAARLVNAVLRAMLRQENWQEPTDLATRYSHPQPLVSLLLAEFGEEGTQALLRCHNAAPQTTVQVNTLKLDAATLCERLQQQNIPCTPHPWQKTCLLLSGSGSLEQLAAFREGLFYVQDTAAHLAVEAARLLPGMRVLDCCAAPGGKSFAAAIAMHNQGELISCDLHPHKLRLIEAGAQRLGIRVITTRVRDAAKPDETLAPRSFDAVLCDVPCSGLGIIRKKPDIRYKDLTQTERLPGLQADILSQQAQYVRPGGVLLYSTCTVLRRENQAVCETFLRTHPDFTAEAVPLLPDRPPQTMTLLLPSEQETDGFFICKFRRKP